MRRIVTAGVLVLLACGESPPRDAAPDVEDDASVDGVEDPVEEPPASLEDFEECSGGTCPEGLVCAMGRCLDPDDDWWAFAPPDPDTAGRIYDTFWEGASMLHPRFAELPGLDWDAERGPWREAALAAGDLGSFFGVLSNMTYLLRDSHAVIRSLPMEVHPAALALDFRASGLGVCTTLDAEDRLVVYRVHDGEAGLVPGDEIETIDAKGWRQVRDELEQEGYRFGLNPHDEESIDHLWAASLLRFLGGYGQMTARGTDGVAHVIDLAALPGFETYSCTLRPEGTVVEETTYGELASNYGSDSGSLIVRVLASGVVYAALRWEGGESTTSADLAALMEEHAAAPGIILDMRLNLGGQLYAAHPVWEALLTEPVSPAIEWVIRDDEIDRTAMRLAETRDMDAGGGTPFAGRLAVLTGPGAVSAGDCTPWLLSQAGARRFGLPTDGTCSSPAGLLPLDAGAYEPAVLLRLPLWMARDPSDHVPISGVKIEPEVRVWLTREDLAAGVDTVLEAAEAWILSG